jgi:hypothetical protein
MLARLLLPRRSVGYDLLVYVGLQRWVHRHQREQIRERLSNEYGVVLSTGEVSALAHDFLVYLEVLHHAAAPKLRQLLSQDGGYPLHIDATGQSGRGTLLVALAGWRGWVLGSWKIGTERADAILPRLRATVDRFGHPCAVMRDLGPAVIQAANELVTPLDTDIPVLGCHFHFLRDVGKDLLTEAHDKLRSLFRHAKVRPNLRAMAREIGRTLGSDVQAARISVECWLTRETSYQLPRGSNGLATVRALAQWVLDYNADSNDEGFPFDVPYLDLQRRCAQTLQAVEAFLRSPHPDAKVWRALQRLHRIVEPVRSEVPFDRTAIALERRVRLFTELRQALRLRVKPKGELPFAQATAEEIKQLQNVDRSIKKLTDSLRNRRPQRGPANDSRKAIDLILAHLERHGASLGSQVVRLPENVGGGYRLVARTNLALEGFFGAMSHAERRRSGRKHLAQDYERMPGAAPLAHNLTCPDYVQLLCGHLDELPIAFAQLDAADRSVALPVRIRAAPAEFSDVTSASLPAVDRALVRSKTLECRIRTAARSRAPHLQPNRKGALAQAHQGKGPT